MFKSIKNLIAPATMSVAAISAASPAAMAAEIIVAPADYAFVNAANPGKGYFDVMVQTILIHNDGAAPVTLTALQIDVFGDGSSMLNKSVPVDRVIGQTREFAGMAAQGFTVFLNAQLLNEAGIISMLGDGAAFAANQVLAPGEALIATSQYFATDIEPGQIVITASFINDEGELLSARRSLKVRRRHQEIDYIAPLKGAWLMRAFPNVRSHHRFIPSNEFALDFFKTGADGALDNGGRKSATDDFGFGQPIHAVADGEVIFVIDDQTQDPEALMRQDGESIKDARARITRYQMGRFAENFRAAAAGNLVTIKHEKDGQTEYSSYGHLDSGSVAVTVGDRVKQGDVIGLVGNTGDSTLTHLHFQLNDGADAFHTRSLPVTFSNAEPLYMGQDPGLFMKFGE